MSDIWEQLARIVHLDNHRLVLALGCFDVCHISHVRHLEAAKRFGDALIVVVTPDKFVRKGPGRPIFGENDRASMLRSLRCVDFAVINEWPTAVEVIHLLRPNFYAKGRDTVPSPEFLEEIKAAESIGCQVVFTEEKTFHTTQLLEALRK